MAWSISVAGHQEKCSVSCYYGHPGKERMQASYQNVSLDGALSQAKAFIEKCLAEHPELEDEPPPEAAQG